MAVSLVHAPIHAPQVRGDAAPSGRANTGFVSGNVRTTVIDSAMRWGSARINRGALRIIVYHGVCRDEDRDARWVPSHYVSQSALDDQLATIKRAGQIIDLREAAALLASGRSWTSSLFAVTFDDAPANLVTLAAPVLAAHGVRTTVFAVTDRLDDAGLLDADALQARFGPHARSGFGHRGPHLKPAAGLPADLHESLRHMNWHELCTLADAGHWIGAHTRSHTILSGVSSERRRDEIEGSVAALRAALRTVDVPFAFPVGQRRHFDLDDVHILRELGVPLACTAIAGPNRPPADPLLLRRNCVGLYHGRAAFCAELLGLRDRRHEHEDAP